MWILTRQVDGKIVRLLCNKEYTIGRGRDCDVVTGTDQSVSRKHLVVSSTYDASLICDLDAIPELKVKDLGSAYGTMINSGPKLSRDTWVTLNEGDEFTVGEKNKWTAKWEDVCVTCSSLVSSDAKKLRNCLQGLGGKILPTWCESSTHLVVSKIVFTQKIQEALISSKPIVSVSYFEKWVEELRRDPSKVPELDMEDYIPPVQDPSIAFSRSVFLPNEDRKIIFQDKVFLFPSRLMKDTHDSTIALGGGTSYLLEEYRHNKLETENIVLLEWPKKAGHPTDLYLALLAEVKSRGQRSIPDRDIGYAIAECSTQRYCNPNPVSVTDKVFAPVVGAARKEQASSRQEIFAAETQPLSVAVHDEVIAGGFSKRILEDSLDATLPPDKRQRIASEETQATQEVIPGVLPAAPNPGHALFAKDNGRVTDVFQQGRTAAAHSKSRIVDTVQSEGRDPVKRIKLENQVTEERQKERANISAAEIAAESPVAEEVRNSPEQDMFTDSPPNEQPKTTDKLPAEPAPMKKKQPPQQKKQVQKTSNGTLNNASRKSTSIREKFSRSMTSSNDVSLLLSPEEFGKRLVIAPDRPRIRQMRVSRFRDGRWITEPEIITQPRPPPRVIFSVSKL